MLPTESVLKCWQQPGHSGKCPLGCSASGSLQHILTQCRLKEEPQSRIKWRHDSVLLAIFKAILSVLNRHKKSKQEGKQGKARVVQPPIVFKSTEATKYTAIRAPRPEGISKVVDWKLQFDLQAPAYGQTPDRMFPMEIIEVSDKRPDGVIWSCSSQTVIWIELTSPWEENMELRHFEKKERYAKLAMDIRAKGWTVHPLEVEVGCRGYIASQGFVSMCKLFEFTKAEQDKLKNRCKETAQHCSHAIFTQRFQRVWEPKPLLDVGKWHND